MWGTSQIFRRSDLPIKICSTKSNMKITVVETEQRYKILRSGVSSKLHPPYPSIYSWIFIQEGRNPKTSLELYNSN